VILVVDVPQAVDDHGVDQFGVAHAETVARAVQHVRRGAHVFHAASNDNVGIAAFDCLRGQVRGLEAAAAHLADDKRRHHIGQAGLDDCLARRVLAVAGGEHLAQDDFVDAGRIEPDLRQQVLDDVCAKFGCRNFCQRATKFADGRAAGSNDYDIFHVSLQYPGLARWLRSDTFRSARCARWKG
jgi:hypothetical protein